MPNTTRLDKSMYSHNVLGLTHAQLSFPQAQEPHGSAICLVNRAPHVREHPVLLNSHL